MQSAALAAGQDLARDLECVEPRVAEHRRPERDVDAGQRDPVGHDLALLATERRGEVRVGHRWDRRVGRDPPEVPLDRCQCGGRVDVADDREDGIVGRVVGAEEGLHVVERGRVEVVHRPDRRMVIRVSGRVQVGLDLLVPGAVRPVVVARTLLVLDHVTLVVEVVLAECVEQAAHPVRLEPQRQVELMGRHGLEVVRPIQPGRAVHGPARGLDERDVLRLLQVGGALEHDVLEQVSEPGLALDLVLAPDVVPDVDRHDRCEMVLRDDHAQAVGQTVVAELDGGNGHADIGSWQAGAGSGRL